MDIVPQSSTNVKTEPYQQNSERADILTLADDCLERHNDAWARFVATGDHEAFLQAMNAKADRDDLLKQVSHD